MWTRTLVTTSPWALEPQTGQTSVRCRFLDRGKMGNKQIEGQSLNSCFQERTYLGQIHLAWAIPLEFGVLHTSWCWEKFPRGRHAHQGLHLLLLFSLSPLPEDAVSILLLEFDPGTEDFQGRCIPQIDESQAHARFLQQPYRRIKTFVKLITIINQSIIIISSKGS